ncbi:hypothetical protein HanXRQr2_Chr10g0431851 [Helianthus annuus]|uniref:Uncharacterized protein n=1 Tax=Helianthus annuus TaxID=4232 RepID=A0A9K3HVV6_HELAN|nr:hypothetical protein HanXRQr2_Chr10g0431851 [Helianthus annuus]
MCICKLGLQSYLQRDRLTTMICLDPLQLSSRLFSHTLFPGFWNLFSTSGLGTLADITQSRKS